MTEWTEFDAYVKQDIAKTHVNSGMLKAHLTVLLAKRMVKYTDSADVIQQLLLERYDVEYGLSDIDLEMRIMIHEEQEADRYTLIEEEME